MKLPRRNFLHLVARAAALPAVSRVATAQAYPTRPVRIESARRWKMQNPAPERHIPWRGSVLGTRTNQPRTVAPN